MKRIFQALFISLFLVGIFGFCNNSFADEYLDAANKLANKGIITNNSSNTANYRLYEDISRGEMAKITINLANVDISYTCNGIYDDLTSSSNWTCKYAESGYSNGFFAKNTNFRPNDKISKIEALKMIMQARNIEKNSDEDWKVAYVRSAYDHGLIDLYFLDYNEPAERGWIFDLATRDVKNSAADLDIPEVYYSNNYDNGGIKSTTNSESSDSTGTIVDNSSDIQVATNTTSGNGWKKYDDSIWAGNYRLRTYYTRDYTDVPACLDYCSQDSKNLGACFETNGDHFCQCFNQAITGCDRSPNAVVYNRGELSDNGSIGNNYDTNSISNNNSPQVWSLVRYNGEENKNHDYEFLYGTRIDYSYDFTTVEGCLTYCGKNKNTVAASYELPTSPSFDNYDGKHNQFCQCFSSKITGSDRSPYDEIYYLDTDSNTKNLRDYVAGDTKILYFGVYESEGRKGPITIDLNYKNGPAIIVLGSYHKIEWNLKNIGSNIKAIFYMSYEEGTYVKTDNGTNPEIINLAKIDSLWSNLRNTNFAGGYSYDINYYDLGNGEVHIENEGISSVNDWVKQIFGKNIYGYNGAYSTSSGELPKITITAKMLEEESKKLEELKKKDSYYGYTGNNNNNSNNLTYEDLYVIKEGCYTFDKYSKAIIDYDASCGKEVNIPSKIGGMDVEIIGNNAFYSKGLTSIKFPETLRVIKYRAFGYNNIKNLEIPDNVRTIQARAFNNNNLNTVTVANKSINIDGGAFDERVSIDYVRGDANRIVKDGCLYFDTELQMIQGYDESCENDKIVIPSSISGKDVKGIQASAFEDSYINGVTIPNTVKYIGSSAFQRTNLGNIFIPNSVEYIGDEAFEYAGLNDLQLGNGVKVLLSRVFINNNLTKVIIPEGVEILGDMSLWNNQITEVEIPKSLKIINGNALGLNPGKNKIDEYEGRVELKCNGFVANVKYEGGSEYLGDSCK